MTHSAYELHVTLEHIEPAIWRTLEIDGRAALEDVHYAIQVAMGWTNSHLHQFAVGKRRYGSPGRDDPGDLEDELEYTLEDVAGRGTTFRYEYDFGDGWVHEIAVRRVSQSAKPVPPRCVAGERACPPEDCGGPPGYATLLEALANPKHPRHRELKEWVPKGFDPERAPRARDLTRDVAALKRVAEGDQEDAPDDDDPLAGLPEALVEEALELPPMQRAGLVAILAGSLADQLIVAVDALRDAQHARSVRPKAASGAGQQRGKSGGIRRKP